MFSNFTGKTLGDITPGFLKEVLLHGIDLEDKDGFVYPESAIQFQINMAISFVQETLQIPLKKTIVKMSPIDASLKIGVDYDLTRDRLAYRSDDARQYYKLLLPDSHIQSVEQVRCVFRGSVIFTFNPKDVFISSHKAGLLHIIPRSLSGLLGSGGQIAHESAITLDQALIGRAYMPEFWAVDYTCGLDSTKEFPDRLLEYISLKAAVNILPVVGNARVPGIASRSLSFDSYSHNESLTQNAESHLYSALQKAYQERLEQIDLREFRGLFRGFKVYSS